MSEETHSKLFILGEKLGARSQDELLDFLHEELGTNFQKNLKKLLAYRKKRIGEKKQ